MEMKKTFKVKIFMFNKFTFFFLLCLICFMFLLFLLKFVCECQKNVPKKILNKKIVFNCISGYDDACKCIIVELCYPL